MAVCHGREPLTALARLYGVVNIPEHNGQGPTEATGEPLSPSSHGMLSVLHASP